MGEQEFHEIGRISHFFTKINVAVAELTSTISVGDQILIKGPTTDFKQTVTSMQIEHDNVTVAKAGQSIGLKVDERVRENDTIYKIL